MLEPKVQKDNLKTLAKLGQALWSDFSQAEHKTLEAYIQEPDLERAALVMFSWVLQDGSKASGAGIHKPFFRLQAEERFILSLLHNKLDGHFTYEHLGKVLGKSAEMIETMAWSARVRLAASSADAVHPTGSAHLGVSCPEYDFTHPWTQRFFDDEVKPQERLFLQNHMAACRSCRDALGRCRKLYYAVDAQLHEIQSQRMKNLESLFGRIEKSGPMGSRSSKDLIRVWLSNWDVRIALAAGLGLILIRIFI